MNLDQMWEALEKYQPHAEKYGFGEAWLRMTTERTPKAAWKAWNAAQVAQAWYAAAAAEAAFDLDPDADSADETAEGARCAINYITRAIERENKP